MSILTTKRRRRPADVRAAWLGAGMIIGCAMTLIIFWVLR